MLQIATRKEKKPVIRGNYRINFIIQQNTITKENIPVLQLLDCLRFFKNIPDAMPDDICRRLLVLFKQLTQEQVNMAKRLAIKYPPSTIALLGAILETNNENEDTSTLYKALNHQSSYKKLFWIYLKLILLIIILVIAMIIIVSEVSVIFS